MCTTAADDIYVYKDVPIMKEFFLKTTIHRFETVREFADEFQIGKGDLLFCNRHFLEDQFRDLKLECDAISPGDYGKGEPDDDMVDAMSRDIKGSHKRIIAVGGGTVMDLAKLFALQTCSPASDLFDGKIDIIRDKKLVLVPTTCGTGSEVTNISILSLNKLGTKKGLAVDQLYADDAVIIPELVRDLPYDPFSTSSLDALVHSVESALSPKATEITRMFAYRAMGMIVRGYLKIAQDGPDARKDLMTDFLMASTYAGMSFSVAGNGAVHAMSYPLGALYHVPHGESNYAMFTGVMKNYLEIRTDGEMAKVVRYLSYLLRCEEKDAFDQLDKLTGRIRPKKALHEYGMTREQIEEFTDSVIANQQRLLANSFVPFDRDRFIKVYTELF